MKIFVFNKYAVISAFIAFVIVLCILPLSMAETKPASGIQGNDLPIYSVDTGEKKVAITFNAAWGAEDIDSILETLQMYDCRCTFFLVGNWAEKYPEQARKIKEAGHEIASHGYDHAHYAALSEAEMRADMDKCEAILKEITGADISLFRAPYGEYTESLVRLCNETGRYSIQWDVDSLDYKGLSAREMEARIMPRLRNGSIILFHTGTEQTASALPALLEEIRAEGYAFSTVGDLLHKGKYTVDHTGRQLPCLE